MKKNKEINDTLKISVEYNGITHSCNIHEDDISEIASKMFDLIIGCSYGSELLVKEFREIAKKHISLGTALLEQIEMRE